MNKLVHNTKKKTGPGKFYPMGAQPDEKGVNFAIYSQNAWEVFLLLFSSKDDETPSDVFQLKEKTRNIFHIYIEGVKPGQLYGFKIRGEYNPSYGLRFNENKLLIDPYAKALSHKFYNKDNLLLGYDCLSERKDLDMDQRDNAGIVPKCVVLDDRFEWDGDSRLDLPMGESVIYEAHVKGFTKDPSSGARNPGTYLGVIDKIPYLKSLGVTALEFLPVHEYYIEDFIINKGLSNYWGYNTIAFFSPEQLYGTQTEPGCQVREFKTMVKALHRAGIEVILDVVFNHTAEGNELGPTLSFKGIDNASYYYLTGNHSQPSRYYMNYTGCGNSVNLTNTPVIKFVMDCLRYWVEVMHVDGFRFDLASVLGREYGSFQKSSGFFDAISQDPILGRIKLIAEPWDLGTYEVGNFPIDWSEWNGKFRDTVRKFVKGDNGQLKDLAKRLAGSSDLYGDDGRTPYNSVNFITCHDGFTLHDLVSYNTKHNEANLESNNDGSNDNHSWNCGAEGDTDDPSVLRLRRQQIKNLACLQFLSLGTPMLLGGDEFGRTQNGNNNAYCQDNALGWIDWKALERNRDLFEFFRKVILLRNRCKVFRGKTFFTGTDKDLDNINDIRWYNMFLNQPDWANDGERKIAFQLDLDEEGSRGESLYIVYNMDWVNNFFALPRVDEDRAWRRVIDTSLPAGQDILDFENAEKLLDTDHYIVNSRSTIVLISTPKA